MTYDRDAHMPNVEDFLLQDAFTAYSFRWLRHYARLNPDMWVARDAIDAVEETP